MLYLVSPQTSLAAYRVRHDGQALARVSLRQSRGEYRKHSLPEGVASSNLTREEFDRWEGKPL